MSSSTPHPLPSWISFWRARIHPEDLPKWSLSEEGCPLTTTAAGNPTESSSGTATSSGAPGTASPSSTASSSPIDHLRGYLGMRDTMGMSSTDPSKTLEPLFIADAITRTLGALQLLPNLKTRVPPVILPGLYPVIRKLMWSGDKSPVEDRQMILLDPMCPDCMDSAARSTQTDDPGSQEYPVWSPISS